MNFRTSHLVGLLASALVILTSTSGMLSAAEPLKITGPDGESRQTLRQYGPTTSVDTFWSIAQKMRPDSSVTIYQVMAAIYDANPHAFSSDNYNSLEKGMILLIPSKEVMAAIPNSLAKQQAQRNDKGWQQAKNAAPVEKVTPTKAEQKTVTPVDSVPVLVSVETKKQIEELTAKLEALQARNLSLTDELARAQDKLNLGVNDSEMLQGKIDELNTRNAELEEALLVQKEQNAELSNEAKMLREQLTAPTQPVVEEVPTDHWRTLMSSPLYLALAVVIPAILLLVIVWLALKRRSNAAEDKEVVEDNKVLEPEPSPDLGASAPTEEEMIAVYLDTDEADSLDSLMSVDASELKPEADLSDDSNKLDMAEDMVVDSGDSQQKDSFEEEEGQSLDDLWAEAMGEQEDELNAGDSPQEDDLDSLLADLDTPKSSSDGNDDLDDLMASLDDESPKDVEETDLDDMMSEFDLPADTEEKESAPEEEDLDALLAEFDLPQMGTDDQTVDDKVDLTDEIAAELDSVESDVDEADLDSLLAEFDTSSQAPKSEDALIEEVTAPTDDDSDDVAAQIAAELASEEDETPVIEDVDALLAGFETEPAEDIEEQPAVDIESPVEGDVASDDSAEIGANDEPIDSNESDSSVLASSESELEAEPDPKVDDKSALEFESFAIEDAANSEPEEVAAEISLDGSADDVALDALLADLEAVDKKEDKEESGFFNDLKGNKRSDANTLDWDSSFASDDVDESIEADDSDDEFSIDIQDDDSLTVDQALAALDAAESKKKPAKAVDEHDLSAFQQDNGFIDIDRLLNEADEDDADVDQYKELDVDMGELDDLMSNASMVDVDDEENAVNAKLDLARAYIEIDDIDSAKALLKEVELDGNERQQEEALGLLKEL
ncbi:FimV/HubP family polar landmark protein [Shewanella psychrotolerans]|uniref:FimV/HubP family polar landmark protein n=1 Tax=Shewanella psychrotolerans TaxID=2864206 RepID=UPI001C65D5B2|nr:FimV/HubP family polar landmark protein [Shewanella psychrotolerans]QYK02860.1 hypothetical protein K0I62_07980 [Shewanella psychrotolerans]